MWLDKVSRKHDDLRNEGSLAGISDLNLVEHGGRAISLR